MDPMILGFSEMKISSLVGTVESYRSMARSSAVLVMTVKISTVEG